MSNATTQAAKAAKNLSLDGVVSALRRNGFTVRHYGNPDDRLIYECFNRDAYAIRDEAGLRAVLAGTDSYFRSRF